MMQILLIRHTRVATAPSICYGQTDVSLAQSFEKERIAIAQRVEMWQAAQRATHLYVSPLSRCRQLADFLAQPMSALSPTIDERLLEISFGQWEHRAWNDLPPDELQHWMSNYLTVAPPDGESVVALWQRCQSFLTMLETIGSSAIVVAHGGSIRALMCAAMGLTAADMLRFHLDYGAVVGLKRGFDGGWQLQFLMGNE